MKIKVLIVSLASLFLISCGDSGKSGSSLSTNGNELRGKPQVNAQSTAEEEALSPSGITRGRIVMDDYWNNDTQASFDQHVKSFLSPQLKSTEVGIVSGSETNTETGISFWGRGLKYKGGALNPLTVFPQEDAVFSEDEAELRISIFQKKDQGTDDISDDTIEEIAIHFNDSINGHNSGKLIDSVVSGKYVQLIFADSYGKVSLSGNFVNDNGQDYYIGQVLFKNLVGYNKAPLTTEHQAEVLGRFKIRVCGMFVCN